MLPVVKRFITLEDHPLAIKLTLNYLSLFVFVWWNITPHQQIIDQSDSFLDNLESYYEDFDVDEHIEMWVNARGDVSGIPSVRELAKDAEDIDALLSPARFSYPPTKHYIFPSSYHSFASA